MMILPLAEVVALFGAGIVGLLFFLIAIATTVFWIWMIIDCATSQREAGEKIVWLLVIIFLHVLGALIYFVAGRKT